MSYRIIIACSTGVMGLFCESSPHLKKMIGPPLLAHLAAAGATRVCRICAIT